MAMQRRALHSHSARSPKDGDISSWLSPTYEYDRRKKMNENFHIRIVAVLGAGVMGAQIAAHVVNANVETLLFELPAKDGDPNGNVNKALEGLKKLDPSPHWPVPPSSPV